MSLTVVGVLAVAVLIAAFVQGSTGLGFAMIAAPIIGLVDPATLPTTLLLLMVPLNAYVSWRERASLDWRGARWITAGRLPGTFVGLLILVTVSTRQLTLLVGCFTIMAAVAAFIAPAFSPGRRALVAVGLVTGVAETSTGIAGPPLALAYQHQPAGVLRSTVAVCFLAGEVISLAALAAMGNVSATQLNLAFVLLPALVFGTLASRWVLHRLDGTLMRSLVLGFAVASGIVMVAKV